jgi:hypothetical protein
MKKYLLSLATMAMMSVPTTVLAQEEGDIETPFTPTIETGFFRIMNNGYGDVLNVSQKYGLSLDATETTARTMPGSVFYYDTDGMYNFADDMKQFQDEDGNLNITVTQLMQLMATSAWKSGSFTTYELSCQSISLGGYMEQLRKYVFAVLDTFDQSDVVKNFYETAPCWYLCVAMPNVFVPADMESLDTFRAAVKRYMNAWKPYFDLNIYVKGAQNMEHGFLMHFHAPLDISNVQKTQEQINSMRDEDTNEPLGYNYDFFGTLKRMVVEEAAKELNEEAVAYLQHVLDPIELDKEYYIGENEQGELYVVGFTKEAMFGENGELANINQDELLWNFIPVDSENPLLVDMGTWSDHDGYYYTDMFTDFAYQLGEGVEAFYIDAVNENGDAHLVQIADKVPAQTGVILRSMNKAAVSNTLVPVDEEVAAIEGNLLKGTCLPLQLDEEKYAFGTIASSAVEIAGMAVPTTTIAANKCYMDSEGYISGFSTEGIADIDRSTQTNNHVVYDLQGRQLSNSQFSILNSQLSHGIYVVNGKKVVR